MTKKEQRFHRFEYHITFEVVSSIAALCALSPRGRLGARHVDELLLAHLGAKGAVKREETCARPFRPQFRSARCADFNVRHDVPLWNSDRLSATDDSRLGHQLYVSCVP